MIKYTPSLKDGTNCVWCGKLHHTRFVMCPECNKDIDITKINSTNELKKEILKDVIK